MSQENRIVSAPYVNLKDGAGVTPIGWRFLPVMALALIAFDRMVRWRNDSRGRSEDETNLSWRSKFLTALEFVAAFTLFFVSGPGLIVLNKYIYTELSFAFPMFVSNLGNCCLVVVMRGGVHLGLFSLKKPALPWRLFFANVFPLSMCSCLSIVVGNIVYLYISLPLIQILKSGTLVLVMLFSFLLGLERFRWGLVSAVVTIVAGICLSLQSGYDASAEDTPYFFRGVFVMLFGNVMEALRAVILQVSVEQLAFVDSLYWCSPSMALIGLVLSGYCECQQIMQAKVSLKIVIALIGSAVFGGCVSFATFWITKLVGGLSVKVLVNARNIGLVLFSVVVLGEKCSQMEYVGYTVALLGLALYDRARQSAAAVRPAQQKAVESPCQEVHLDCRSPTLTDALPASNTDREMTKRA